MNFRRLTSKDEVLALIEFHNQNSKFMVLDVETTSVKPREAKLIDVQVSGKQEDEAFIFGAEIASPLTNIRKGLVIVAHNYRYDAHVLYRHGIDLLSHTWEDTMLLGHLIDENRESYALDSYVKELFNSEYKDTFWGKYGSYEEATEEEKINYACRDILYTGRLYHYVKNCCEIEGIPSDLRRHVQRLQASLLQTEIRGIRVDMEYLQALGVKIKTRIDEIKPQMRSLVEDDIELLELQYWQQRIAKKTLPKAKANVPRPSFNFESSKQLCDLLYGRLQLPGQRNAKTKSISTDYTSLQRLERLHPVVGLIQENRELQKIYTAYVSGIIDRLDQSRIYPQFRVNGTVTGRISHSSPNMAQLPKSGGVRGIYVPDPGRVLISADYSQLEVIIEANLTSDPTLIRMLENGESKHDLTARELGCEKSTAKTINFCLQYWGSHYAVAKILGCPSAEALGIWNKYWEIYKGPKELKARTDKMVNEGIPLQTAFGRKRRFPIKKRNPWDTDYRQAYNFMIQGTGADLTSKAFYLVDEEMRCHSYGRGLFTVHDEILVESKEKCIPDTERLLKVCMEAQGDSIGFKIPLKACLSDPMDRWSDG